ncbi:MAG: metallophosphoesterase family protein, partial [Desulfatibacillaceae bacterium]|nr:metallophosphoesterase family protein [Desulfatibacillaceae bacterium]
MRIAFLSDIHGNLEAFEAVLKDIDEQVVDMRFCLGDSVGYGADPDRVLKLLFSEDIPSIMGNHDAAIFGIRQVEGGDPILVGATADQADQA